MKREQILPLLLIIIQAGAAIPYAIGHNWRMMTYWMAAAVLNIAVTF